MYENLDVFRMSSAMASHAAARQAAIAFNIANSDTPGFQARTLPSFAAVWRHEEGGSLKTTRPGHQTSGAPSARMDQGGAEPSPNGNSVSIETEMLAGVEAQREHSRALAIWRHGITLLRASLGK